MLATVIFDGIRAIMRFMRWIGIALMAACGSTPAHPDAATSGSADASASDAAIDASPDAAVVLGPWGAPTRVAGVPENVDDPTLTADRLEMYLELGGDIYVTTRLATSDPWNTPTKVEELSSTTNETGPEVSLDGLTIYFGSRRTPTLGAEDIWMSTRPSRLDAWTAPVHIVELSSASVDAAPYVTPDGLSLILGSNRDTSTSALFTSTRTSTSAAWSTPVPMVDLTSGVGEYSPLLSPDRLTLYYDSLASGGNDLFVSTRATTADSFPYGAPIDELVTPTELEADPWVSPDGRYIIFESTRDDTSALWEATR